MSPTLYNCSAASSPAQEFNSAFLWNTNTRTQRQRERGGRKEERLYSALCHWQPAQELNAANPGGIQECGDGEIMWQWEDNISSAISDCKLKGSKLTRLFGIYMLLFPLFTFIETRKFKSWIQIFILTCGISCSLDKNFYIVKNKTSHTSRTVVTFSLVSWETFWDKMLYCCVFNKTALQSVSYQEKMTSAFFDPVIPAKPPLTLQIHSWLGCRETPCWARLYIQTCLPR